MRSLGGRRAEQSRARTATPEPFELESPRQLELLARKLAHGVGVVAFPLPAVG
jgi:hypothetical protein